MTKKSKPKPIWFLGVDGVVNAVSLSPPEGFITAAASPGGDYGQFTINYDPEIAKRIRHLHESNLVQVMWLTTWGSGANGELRELLGLPEFEVADEPPLYSRGGYEAWDDTSSGWWKLRTVKRFYEDNPDRKYVWTDDDIALEPEAREWVLDKNIYAVAPSTHKSLTAIDLNFIEQFLIGNLSAQLREAGRMFSA